MKEGTTLFGPGRGRWAAARPCVQGAEGVVARLDEPVDAELQVVAQQHLGEQHLDQDLATHDVELLERALDHVVIGGRGEDEEGVRVLVRDDPHFARGRPGRAGNLERGRGRRRRHRRGRRLRGRLRLAERRGADFRGTRARGECRGGGRGAPRREQVAHELRQVLRLAVADLVDEEARAGAGAAELVEAVDPGPRRLEVLRLRGHHEERVEALDRDHAHHARERAALGAEDLVEVGDQRLHVGALDREEADRVAREEIGVEKLDRLDEVLDLALRARHHHEVAHLVHADRVVRRERLQELLHLLRADELEGHHDHRESRGIGVAEPPICGVTDPRTAAIGTTLYRPSSITTAALFCRSSSSSVGRRSRIGIAFTVRKVTTPVTPGCTVYETFR
jgi:hypothetical protein